MIAADRARGSPPAESGPAAAALPNGRRDPPRLGTGGCPGARAGKSPASVASRSGRHAVDLNSLLKRIAGMESWRKAIPGTRRTCPPSLKARAALGGGPGHEGHRRNRDNQRRASASAGAGEESGRDAVAAAAGPAYKPGSSRRDRAVRGRAGRLARAVRTERRSRRPSNSPPPISGAGNSGPVLGGQFTGQGFEHRPAVR